MTEPTIESLQAEITRLKAHADDLLAERRAEKARREAAETTLETIQTAHDGLVAKLDDLTLTGPVLRALEGVTVAPPAKGRKLLEDAGVKFVINSEGTPVALDGEEEVALSDLYLHLSERCRTPEGMNAFGWFVVSSGASGGGAMGGGGSHFHTTPPKEQKAIKPAQNLGLR